MKRTKAFTIIELIIVIGVFLVMFAFLAPVVEVTRERANNINCGNNLRKISLGLHLYASEHEDAFPPDLAALYPNYVKEAGAFDCPGTKTVGTPEKPDYHYVENLTESSDQNEIIAYDLDGNHKKHERNILRINGSVEWVGGGEGKPR